MAEDAFYSQSTQFECWQFPQSKLEAIRRQTNDRGARSIKRTWRKARDEAAAAIAMGQGTAASAGTEGGEGGGTTPDQVEDPEPLTVEEEAALVLFYCVKTIELADHLQFPSNVKATAVTFLRRFHLHHSPMGYHPKHHLPTVLFLATKTENHYVPLSDFCKRIPLNITDEAVLKHEFLVAGGVQWDLDVRHPLRAAEGAVMELLTLIGSQEPSSMHDGGASWQDKLGPNKREAADRVKDAHGKMKSQLTNSALLSDAYFLYTPPQIFLGALYSVDEVVAAFYINWKFGDDDSSSSSHHGKNKRKVNGEPVSPKVDVRRLLATVKACAEHLSTADSHSKVAPEELRRIDKKLYMCQNPHKYIKGHPGKSVPGAGGTKASTPAINVVGEAGGGGGGGGQADETTQQKKRRMEREKAEKEGDVFGGPSIKNSGGGSGSSMFGEMLKRKQGES